MRHASLRGRLHAPAPPFRQRRSLSLVALIVILLAGCGAGADWSDTDRDPAPIGARYDVREALRQGRVDEGVAAAQALVGRFPRSWQAQRALQDALRRALSEPEFLARYEDRADRSPDDALAAYLLGRARIGDGDAARAAFKRSIALDPGQPWPYVALAYLHYAHGDLFSAVELYESAIRQLPRSRALRLSAANQYIELRLLAKAQGHLRVAMRLAPDDPEIQAALGKVELGLGNEDGARRWLESALSSEPRMGDAWMMMAQLELRTGHAAPADDAYRQGLRLGQSPDPELATAIRVGLITEATR